MTDNKTGSVNSLNSVNIPSKIVNQHFVSIDFHKMYFFEIMFHQYKHSSGSKEATYIFFRIYFDIRSCKFANGSENRNKFGGRTFCKNFFVLKTDSQDPRECQYGWIKKRNFSTWSRPGEKEFLPYHNSHMRPSNGNMQ